MRGGSCRSRGGAAPIDGLHGVAGILVQRTVLFGHLLSLRFGDLGASELLCGDRKSEQRGGSGQGR